MEEKKGNTLIAPATVYYTEDGVLSININITDNDNSPLRIMLEGKHIDESQSVIGVFSQEIQDSNYLPRSTIMFSGVFKLIENDAYYATKNKDVLDVLALRLQDKEAIASIAASLQDKDDNDLCEVCANQQTCKKLNPYRHRPRHRYCVTKIAKYFLSKAKNESSN